MFITNIIALSLLGSVLMGSEKESQPVEAAVHAEVKKWGTDPTSCEIIEFEESEFNTANNINTAYSNGTPITIAAYKRQPNGSYATDNAARLFDTSGAPGTAGQFRTPNTNAMRPMGNVLRVSNGSNGENALQEGRIEMDFTAMGSITLKGIHVLDIEKDEDASTIELYDQSGKLIKTMPLPVTGTHGATRLRIDTPGVQKMVVTFAGKNNKGGNGAIDVIEFCRD
jgi:hypothetical protein